MASPDRPGSADIDREAVRALSGVPATLTISLAARATASRRDNPIIADPVAESLTARLGLHPDEKDSKRAAVEVGTAVRTELLDKATQRFAHAHPGGTVVTLGAGLCTRFARLSGLDVRWIDVDLPEVAAIRAALLAAGENRMIVAGSVLDPGWKDAVDVASGQPVLFILEGLLMYFTADQARSLITGLANEFPGSDLAVEAIGTLMTRQSSRRQPASVTHADARFTWGVQDFATVAAWHPRLHLAATWYMFDYHRDHWSRQLRAMRHIRYLRAQSKIGYFHIDQG
jgi:methyltransferase (TIGR00027 family)